LLLTSERTAPPAPTPATPDDANLVCHVLDEALDETIKIRRAKGLRE
jgi:hypothetical protein